MVAAASAGDENHTASATAADRHELLGQGSADTAVSAGGGRETARRMARQGHWCQSTVAPLLLAPGAGDGFREWPSPDNHTSAVYGRRMGSRVTGEASDDQMGSRLHQRPPRDRYGSLALQLDGVGWICWVGFACPSRLQASSASSSSLLGATGAAPKAPTPGLPEGAAQPLRPLAEPAARAAAVVAPKASEPKAKVKAKPKLEPKPKTGHKRKAE